MLDDRNPPAFEELVNQYGEAVYEQLTTAGLSPATAEELFRRILLHAHCKVRRYDPKLPIQVWLLAITNKVLRSHFRRQRIKRIFFAPDQDLIFPGLYFWCE